jgi:tripartite-type tricarboxylate transporter receptor subunit TctC
MPYIRTFGLVRGFYIYWLAALGLLPGLFPNFVMAQEIWPNKLVRLVVPFPAGGATDTLGRVLAQSLSADVGQPVIVENRPGAAGAIGSEAVAKSAPDGYTLLLATSSTHSILPNLSSSVPFDPVADFTPIAEVAEGGSLLVVTPKLPVANVAQLITYARQNKGAVNYASSGVGSIPHLMGAYFAGLAGLQILHVPYKGSSLSYSDLKAGQVQILFDSLVTALPQVKAGNVRALAITSKTRSAQAPDIPTMAEAGLPGYVSMTWFGILGPKGMNPQLTTHIAAAIHNALQSPQLRSRYSNLGMDVSTQGPEQFAHTIARESAKWKKVIREQKVAAE